MSEKRLTPEERASLVLDGLDEDYLYGHRIMVSAARAIRAAEAAARAKAFEEAADAAHAAAKEYDMAREKFLERPSQVEVARKYADMRDGALAAEVAIRVRAKEAP